MNNFFMLSVMAVIWGCLINQNFALTYQSVDPKLAPYVNNYFNEFRVRCPKKESERHKMYDIEFVPNSDEWVGVCKYRLNGYKISINKDWWDTKSTDLEKHILMYHELSHCVLNKDHVDDINNYMFPVLIPLRPEVFIPQVRQDIDEYCAK